MIWMLAYATAYLATGAALSFLAPRYTDDRILTILIWPLMAVSMAVVWIHEFRRAPE